MTSAERSAKSRKLRRAKKLCIDCGDPSGPLRCDRCAGRNSAWAAAHPQAIRASRSRFLAKNPGYYVEYARKYRKSVARKLLELKRLKTIARFTKKGVASGAAGV